MVTNIETYDGQPLTDPQMYLSKNLDYIRQRWDIRATRWDEYLKDPSFHCNRKNSYERFCEILKIIIHNNPNRYSKYSFVDLACGTGSVLKKCCSPYIKKQIGVDISSKMLYIAKRKLQENVELIQDDIFHYLDMPIHAWGIVSRGIILSHYGKKLSDELLRKVYNALIPSGFCFFDVINLDSDNRPYGKTAFSKSELQTIFCANGFKNIVVYGETNYPLLYAKAEK